MMKRRFLLLFLCALFLFGATIGSADDFLKSNGDVKRYGSGFQAPARRSLLVDNTEGPDTALVAALDGTIYLLEVGSMKPLWSFSTGAPIYSSYQAPLNDNENSSELESSYYIDCGDDWELYAHNSLGKLKLMKSLEEYISSTPQIAENGGIVLGSKKTTAFLVDAKSGKVIHTYSMSDSPSTVHNVDTFPCNATFKEQYPYESNIKTDSLPLFITRTDYKLKSFLPNSDKILWNMTVAEIGAAFLCQDVEKSLESSEPDLPYNMPLPCHSRALVYRFRDHNMLESLSLAHGSSSKAPHQDMMLPADALPSQPNLEKVLKLLPLPDNTNKLGDSHGTKDHKAVLPSHSFNESGGITNAHEVKVLLSDGLITLQRKFNTSQIILVFVVLFIIYHYAVVSRIKAKLAVLAAGTSPTNTHTKRKKSRRAGKGGSNDGKQDKEENEVQHIQNENDNSSLLNLNQSASFNGDERAIGKLVVSNKEIAKGSNGTIVLEGIYEGRPVAVKRLVSAYNDIAFKEIQNLIMSDRHPNVVRWYGVEQDKDFVYLALERCSCSLNDLILMHLKSSGNQTLSKNLDTDVEAEYTIRLASMKSIMPQVELWNSDGYPSTLLLKLMRDVISGLAHLHELGIVHRDLKPQNVLIISERSLCAKLSDMGISKCLVGDMSALSNHTGCGSSGWQAPELLLHGRQTRAVDMFSLGCVLFFCITGGKHPFGNRLERDVNISKNKVDLFMVEHIPEAVDLLMRLLDFYAEIRPRAVEVLNHPLFWSAEMRLNFLRDTSDRVELEDRETPSDLLKSLESVAPMALGGKWNEKMDPSFLSNMGHYRRYRFDSVRDLLRVMRNKLNHYRELPLDIQEMIGPVPEGFDRYFRSRFPKLFIQVYNVMKKYCSQEDCFVKYFSTTSLL